MRDVAKTVGEYIFGGLALLSLFAVWILTWAATPAHAAAINNSPAFMSGAPWWAVALLVVLGVVSYLICAALGLTTPPAKDDYPKWGPL